MQDKPTSQAGKQKKAEFAGTDVLMDGGGGGGGERIKLSK
jgi:hypothetical protein